MLGASLAIEESSDMALSISIEERFSDGAGDEAGDAAAGADACETTLWPVLIVAGGGGGTALV